jgi:hypothetical protein
VAKITKKKFSRQVENVIIYINKSKCTKLKINIDIYSALAQSSHGILCFVYYVILAVSGAQCRKRA